MARIDQQVVRQTKRFELRDAAAEPRAQEKPIVGLALHDVADAHQLWMRGESIELGPHVGRLQIEPPDHPGDLRMVLRQ